MIKQNVVFWNLKKIHFSFWFANLRTVELLELAFQRNWGEGSSSNLVLTTVWTIFRDQGSQVEVLERFSKFFGIVFQIWVPSWIFEKKIKFVWNCLPMRQFFWKRLIFSSLNWMGIFVRENIQVGFCQKQVIGQFLNRLCETPFWKQPG